MAELNPTQQEFMNLLKKAGWKPAEAARQLDLSKSIVSAYATGERTPPKVTMLALASLVLEKYDRSGLLSEGGAASPGPIFERIEKLPSVERSRIYAVIETLIDHAESDAPEGATPAPAEITRYPKARPKAEASLDEDVRDAVASIPLAEAAATEVRVNLRKPKAGGSSGHKA